MKIKICGMRRIEDIEMINRYPIDYAGFIFYPKSFRYVTPLTARELGEQLIKAKKVGVFVDVPIQELLYTIKTAKLDIVQLHGKEDQEYINEVKQKSNIEIWKAIRVKEASDLHLLQLKNVDYFVLDSFTKEYGGSGKTFNHELINNINLNNVFIAGGINKDNIKHILSYDSYGLDISSSIETNQYKDEEKLKQLLEEIL